MTIRILDSAKADLINGFHFYEKQHQGLGNYFLDSIYSDIVLVTVLCSVMPHGGSASN